MHSQLLIQLLHAINRAQSTFLATSDSHRAFDQMLQDLLVLTASEYGFIGEIHYNQQGAPYLKTHAITNIAWNDATQQFYEENAPGGLEFTNLQTLFGAALTSGKPVIANDPTHDPRRGGLPEGHPAMNAFLGIPIRRGEHLVGMVGLANRPEGYDQSLVELLEPLLSTVGQLIEARRIEQARLQGQTELKESQERLNLVLAASGDGMWDWNMVTNQIFWDDASYTLLGYQPQQFPITLQVWNELVHPDDLKFATEQLTASVSTGEFLDMEFRYRTNAGSWHWIQGRGRVVERDADGHSRRMVGVHSDISQRKITELRLQDREHRLELATSSSNLGIWDLDLVSGYMEWNPVMFRFYGIQADEFCHTVAAWQNALHPEDQERAQREIALAIEERSEFKSEFRIVRPDGDIRYLRAFARVVCDEHQNVCRIIGINMDITEQKQSEQRLRQSEEKFRNLYELAPVAVIINRLRDGVFMEGNQALYDMTGYSADEFGALSYWDITPRIYEPQEMEQLESLRTRGFYGPFEKAYIHKNGALVPVLLNGKLIDFDGEECIYSVVQNIITIQKAQQALRESEQRFRDVAAAAGGYIWETDTEGNYTFLTRPIEDILGQPLEKLLGHTPFEFMPTDEQQRVGDFFLDAASRQEPFRGLEHYALHSSGKIVWQLVSGLPTYDALGELQGYRGTAMDITHQKQVEASLEAYAKSTQAILDNVVDGIITIDSLGHIKSFNLAAEGIFGYQASEVLSQKINMLMPEPHSRDHDNYLLAYQRTGNARIIGIGREVEGKHKDGHLFPMELSVSEVVQDGEVTYIGMVRDITERKRIERMKNEFVSTVSHELRTPLTSISGSLGLILGTAGGELSAQVKEMLELASRNSRRLAHLINDLLDMEKIAAGKMHFDMDTQALMPLVEQSIEANRSYARQYDVEYQLTDRHDGVTAEVDGQRLMQVLSNFLSNAAKFSPAGSTVEVGVVADRDQVRVEVRDRGPGISDDFRERLFTKFSQADSSDTRAKGGTGLGLAISKEISEQMKGRVGVESRDGGGSVFYVELPVSSDNKL